MMRDFFNKILDSLKRHRGCAVATVVKTAGSAPRDVGAKMIVFDDGSSEGTVGGGSLEKSVVADALVALKSQKSVLEVYSLDKKSGLAVCGGKVSVFIDVVRPSRKLVICGCGHIGLALSFLGKLLDFEVIVVDNRRAFANKKRFPHADRVVCAGYRPALRKIAVDPESCVVIVTHRHLHDGECLEAALRSRAGYIGMIGSHRKIKDVFAGLLEKGFTQARLKKVYSPIGLDIGAETPEEIAVAIAAELIKIQRK